MKTLRFKFHFWGRGLIALYVLFMGCCCPLPYQPDYIMAEVEEDLPITDFVNVNEPDPEPEFSAIE